MNAGNSSAVRWSLVSRLGGASLLWVMGLACASAQEPPVAPGDDDPQRTQPVEPFRIIDNVYFVGARLHNPAYLFTTTQGHILIDSTYHEFVRNVLSNVEKLGFDGNDIELLLSTHAHDDHVGGHGLMKKLTGATVVASEPDAQVIETGGRADFRDRGSWALGKVDRLIEDGEKVRLGDTVLTAHVTPGHTKGCTTWTTVVEEEGESYDLVLLCGARVNTGEPLVDHPDYAAMPRDFAYSFARFKVLPVDVFLGAHGYWYDLQTKLQKLRQGAKANPFIDPGGYHRAIRGWEQAYLDRLKSELVPRSETD